MCSARISGEANRGEDLCLDPKSEGSPWAVIGLFSDVARNVFLGAANCTQFLVAVSRLDSSLCCILANHEMRRLVRSTQGNTAVEVPVSERFGLCLSDSRSKNAHCLVSMEVSTYVVATVVGGLCALERRRRSYARTNASAV